MEETMRGFVFQRRILLISLIVAGLSLPAFAARPSGIGDLRVERHENDALLGVYIEGAHHEERGVEVTRVIRDSAAEAAGLERGDVIVGFDGKPVDDPNDLRELVDGLVPGDMVRVDYVRDGDEQSLRVELGQREPRITVELERPLYVVSDDTRGRISGSMTLDDDDRLDEIYVCDGDDCRFSAEPIWYRLDCFEASCPTYTVNYWGRPLLGVQVDDITAELREHFGADPDAGLLIAKVYEGSPAEMAGIETGDVIVAVDGRSIEESSDIQRALKGKEGDVVEVEVIRDGRSLTLNAELPVYDD
jgi:membrane-associated protease RseP (regulator of RpoE activity)